MRQHLSGNSDAPRSSRARPRHPKPRSSSRTFGLAVYFVSPPRPTWRSNRQPAHPLTCPGKWRQRRREVKPAARPPTCLRQVAAKEQRGQAGRPPTHAFVAPTQLVAAGARSRVMNDTAQPRQFTSRLHAVLHGSRVMKDTAQLRSCAVLHGSRVRGRGSFMCPTRAARVRAVRAQRGQRGCDHARTARHGYTTTAGHTLKFSTARAHRCAASIGCGAGARDHERYGHEKKIRVRIFHGPASIGGAGGQPDAGPGSGEGGLAGRSMRAVGRPMRVVRRPMRAVGRSMRCVGRAHRHAARIRFSRGRGRNGRGWCVPDHIMPGCEKRQGPVRAGRSESVQRTRGTDSGQCLQFACISVR